MTDTTENELFDCIIGNFKSAISDCKQMADPMSLRGLMYQRVKESLKLVEGSSRQIAHWREDSRWLQIGISAEAAHEMLRRWVANHAPGQQYVFMAVQLERWLNLVETMRHAKTEKIGPILPVPGKPDKPPQSVQVILPKDGEA